MANSDQYSLTGIYCYEWMFGPNFLGYGEPQATRNIINQMDWKPGIRVLDVGSGLGGPARVMAEEYGAVVTGVDLTDDTVQIAKERHEKNGMANVSFHQGDIHQVQWGENAFDVIWSRETLLHVPEKDLLFQKFYTWLAPGGRIMITDYARKEGRASDKFEKYIHESGYPLLEMETYGDHIRQAGFEQVTVEDQTEYLIQLLEENIHRIRERKEEFIQRFSEDAYKHFRSRWELKLECCKCGDMKWAWLSARRPENQHSIDV
ncbi:MAG: methyltransferase domain-containing protein [Desulfovermiculus sp.]